MIRQWIGWFSALLPALAIGGHCHAQSVLSYHGSADRSGNFIVPALNWERARLLHLDPSFQPQFAGHLYAQPLFWRPPGSASGVLIVATENDDVHAIDAKSGSQLWTRSLGRPVALSTQPCGNIDPLGITGTPVIDEATQTVYLAAMVGDASGAHHRVFALSLKDGAPIPGWPIDVAEALAGRGQHFNTRFQNQRGALAILGGRVYVPYGGHFGDCGDYHGWVLGISLRDPRDIVSWSTRGRGGGIWAPGGISSDGKSLFIATGNTLGVTGWSDGQAVFRLAPDLHRSLDKQDFFVPPYWRELDETDADLGGTAPIPLDLPAAAGAQAVVLALGKDRHAYLLDRKNLGGIGGGLAAELVARNPIRTAPAVYPASDGVFVAFQGAGARCPKSASDSGLTVLRLRAGAPPGITTEWCAAVRGAGAPIITTTDGRSNPIVWIVGAEGDNRLHGFKGDNGEPLFTGGGSADAMAGIRRFQTVMVAEHRLYVAADSRIYAFGFR